MKNMLAKNRKSRLDKIATPHSKNRTERLQLAKAYATRLQREVPSWNIDDYLRYRLEEA